MAAFPAVKTYEEYDLPFSFSPGFDIADKPVFVHPSGHVIQIHSLEELLNFYELLRREGYAPEYSPVFGF